MSTEGELMRKTSCLILAAVVTLLAPAVRAQQEITARPLVFTYQDANGPGRLTVLDLSADQATGGRQIRVTLSQNGVQSVGSGIMLQLESRMPFPTLIVFSLTNRRGQAYFFKGKTISGITLSGQGLYHPLGSPERGSAWSIVLGGARASASGIRGIALAGPVSPVERPGVPNARPLPGATITVRPARGGEEIAREHADQNGRFEIALEPGTYLIVPLPPQANASLPRGKTETVEVPVNRFMEVVVKYDTGIR
jgi:hypothetical protein